VEYFEVLGTRRSIRYFDPDRTVERDKIEAVLQAARFSSRAMNVPWGKGIVVYREELSEQERNRLKTPFATVEFDLAPVYLLWFNDTSAREKALEGNHYPTVPSGVLQDTAIYGPPHGWSVKYVEKVVLPEVLMPGFGRRIRGGNADAALALTQAYLTAVDEGLGACLAPFDEAGAREVAGAPDFFEPVSALLLGYAAESPEGGGQRPRADWETLFFDGDAQTPYRRDPEVTAELERKGLVQEPAPLPWRGDEVRALSRGLGLEGGGIEAPKGEIPEGAPVNLAPLEEYTTVRDWAFSFSNFWRAPAPAMEAHAALEQFCRFCGSEPDAIIDEILRPEPSGEGLQLRTRARRKWVEIIDDFEGHVGRERANYVRSFMIHNGVAMNPSILR
jgi:nitroreductase